MAQCDIERAAQIAVQRAVEKRIKEISTTLQRRLNEASRAAFGIDPPSRAPSFGTAAARGLGDVAIQQGSRAIARGLANLLLGRPAPMTAGQKDAVLIPFYTNLLRAGVDPLTADQLTQQEYCILEVIDGINTGQLVDAAISAANL